MIEAAEACTNIADDELSRSEQSELHAPRRSFNGIQRRCSIRIVQKSGRDPHCDDTSTDCRPARRTFSWNVEAKKRLSGESAYNRGRGCAARSSRDTD